MNIERCDLITLPNAITTTGLALSLHGSQHLSTTSGIVETAIGRALDVADGRIARATGQTSEFGAAVDASSDKIAGLAIMAGEWRSGSAPKPALAAIFVQNTVNAIATAAALKRHPDRELTPTKDGKYAMATQNLALGVYALGARLHESGHVRSGRALRYLGHAATIVGVGYFGVKATHSYVARSRES